MNGTRVTLWLTLVAVFAVAMLGLVAARADVQEQAPAGDPTTTAPAVLPARFAGFTDQDIFDVYMNEENVATITYNWSPDGTYEGLTTISMGGQSITRALKITSDAAGYWQEIVADSPVGPITLVRDGDLVRRTLNGQVHTMTLKPGAVLWDNFAPALVSQAVAQYDRQQAGRQTLPLVIIPSLVMEATLELLGSTERPVGGRDLQFTRYAYNLPGVDINIWIDSSGRTCLIQVPAQHAVYVRRGFEALLEPEGDPRQISMPQFDVKIEANVAVPMRDGVTLAADLYRPDATGTFPVVLVRTPYMKDMLEFRGRYFARRGYVCAIQDCRGRFASGGEWEPFMNEATDGYDTIEWLAAQPWSTGRIGMIGGSYLGWVQWWAAREHPPHLVTIIPNVSPPDPFYNVPYEYGVFFLLGGIWWADVVESEATADLSGATLSRLVNKRYTDVLRPLPVIDLDKQVLGQENRYWREWIAHPTNDDYWAPAGFLDHLQDVNIPVFHQSGWFDGDGIGTKLNYLRMRSHGHPFQKLILGPWGHVDEAQRRVEDRDFGPNAVIDLQAAYLRWLDHWLKGIDNGIDREPLVSLFTMNSNQWLHGDVYPLPQTRFERWYFDSAGHANTSKGDGRLARAIPAADAPADHYTYDPGDPTPAPHYYEAPQDSPDVSDDLRSLEGLKRARQAYHDEVTRKRSDILVYTTEPLDAPLTIAGPVSAVLYASTSARDTDWFMRLAQVEEDGQIFALVEGKIRARFRESMSQPRLLEPGQVYEYHLDLWHTGITIPAGGRLRVEVASASFPSFSRNLNTGGHNELDTDYVTAEQTIYHNAQYPSHVLLPVIPEHTQSTQQSEPPSATEKNE